MKPLLALIALALATLTGCPGKQVQIHRSLSAPGAMQTCDANKRFRVEKKGSDAADAKAQAEAEIRSVIAQNHGCAALIFNEGSGKALDGTTNHVADYQFCRCQ
jgi:hypothetical protein